MLTLDQFEFGQDHNYHYGDFTLEPVFGGFDLIHKGIKVARKLSLKKTMDMINDYIESDDNLAYDENIEMAHDAEFDKNYHPEE